MSTSRAQKSAPPWEVRILSRLQKYNHDLSQLHKLRNGRLLSQHKVNALSEKYSLNSRSVEEVCEEVRQTVKALSHRLTRYRHK